MGPEEPVGDDDAGMHGAIAAMPVPATTATAAQVQQILQQVIKQLLHQTFLTGRCLAADHARPDIYSITSATDMLCHAVGRKVSCMLTLFIEHGALPSQVKGCPQTNQ